MPHFTSIASFISSYPDAIESVFEQVLMVCDEQGLLGNELIAIDGCKMSSNAAKEHSGTFDELESKRVKIQRQIKLCMKEHKRLDRRKPKERERKDQLEQSINTLSKHQIIVEAQAYGEGQEHHTLQPILVSLNQRYQRAGISEDILKEQIIVTADTGFANEANYEYLKAEKINAYIPDNRFRSRDPKFASQKVTHGKRHQDTVKGVKKVIPASDFTFNAMKKTAVCPAGNTMWLKNETEEASGKIKLFFEGKLTDCRQLHDKKRLHAQPRLGRYA